MRYHKHTVPFPQSNSKTNQIHRLLSLEFAHEPKKHLKPSVESTVSPTDMLELIWIYSVRYGSYSLTLSISMGDMMLWICVKTLQPFFVHTKIAGIYGCSSDNGWSFEGFSPTGPLGVLFSMNPAWSKGRLGLKKSPFGTPNSNGLSSSRYISVTNCCREIGWQTYHGNTCSQQHVVNTMP